MHVLSDEPDGFGVYRRAMCGRHNPDLLAGLMWVNVERRGVRRPVLEDGDDLDATPVPIDWPL
jgi:hypothetical protein